MEPTLADAFAHTVARHRQLRRSPVTTAGYKEALLRYSPDWWDRPLVSIRRINVLRRHQRITALNGPYAANAWARALSSTLSVAMMFYEEALPTNPAQGRFLNPERAREPQVDLPTVVRRIAAIPNPARRATWYMALLTGLRRKDIATTLWANIDLPAATIFVPSPKSGRPFVLPLPHQLVIILDALPRLSPWTFPARSASGHAATIREDGLPGPHALRHAWSTTAQRVGVDEFARALLLNPRPAGGINIRYTHALPVEFRAEQQLVADAILAP